MTEQNQKIAVEGREFTLGRKIDVANSMNVKWFHKNQELTKDRYKISPTGILHITNVTSSDSGEYTCCVYTGNSANIVKIHNLIVKKPIQIVDWIPKYRTAVNQTVKLKCNIITDSPHDNVTVQWFGDDTTKNLESLNKRVFFDINDYSMTIWDVQVSDTDYFTCAANTSYDRTMKMTKLVVQNLSGVPKILKVQCFNKKACIFYQLNAKKSWSFQYFVQYSTSMNSSWVNGSRPNASLEYCHNMRPWLKYEFRVAIFYQDKTIVSEVSSSCVSAPDAPFENPMNVKAESTTPTNLVISWEPTPIAYHRGPGFHYLVYWQRIPIDAKYNMEKIRGWREKTFVLENQPTFTHYRIKVRSANNLGVSRSSAKEILVHSAEGRPTQAPKKFQLERLLNKTSVHLVWLAVPSEHLKGFPQGYKINIWPNNFAKKDVKQYLLSYVTNENNFNEQTWLNTFQDGIIISDLRPHTNYCATILVHNRLHDGPSSAVLNFSTYDTNANNVQSLTAVSNEPSSILLKWVGPENASDQLMAYRIVVKETVGKIVSTSRQFQITDPVINEFKIDGLKANTTYRLSIVAVTSAGNSDRYIMCLQCVCHVQCAWCQQCHW